MRIKAVSPANGYGMPRGVVNVHAGDTDTQVPYGIGWRSSRYLADELTAAQSARIRSNDGRALLRNDASGWVAYAVMRDDGSADFHTLSPDGASEHYTCTIGATGITRWRN